MRWGVALGGSLVFATVLALAALTPLGTRAAAVASPAPTERPIHTASPHASPAPTDPPARPRVGPFTMPIPGHAVPTEAQLLPEAARDHRAGYHEGIDLVADAGTAVVAAGAGRVVRIDHGYVEWTAEERAAAFDEARSLGYTPERTLDRTRGRQVWIDHGGGVVTRYAHLAGVEPIPLGAHVAEGTPVGAVGSSGYPEGGPHLHFEIRVGDSYLGAGLTPAELAFRVTRAFR